MRTTILIAFAAVLLAGSTAQAQTKKKGEVADIGGDYAVKFEEVANNCTTAGMNLRKGTFTIKQTGRKIEASIPIASVMYGKVGKESKFRAKAKIGGTGTQGVLGKFNVSGRVTDGVIQFVFIAEYYTGSVKSPKPLCTQSWNVSGMHSDKLK